MTRLASVGINPSKVTLTYSTRARRPKAWYERAAARLAAQAERRMRVLVGPVFVGGLAPMTPNEVIFVAYVLPATGDPQWDATLRGLLCGPKRYTTLPGDGSAPEQPRGRRREAVSKYG